MKVGKLLLLSGEIRNPLTLPGFLGDFCVETPFRARIPLEERESKLEGEDKSKFLHLIRKMLQREPGMRSAKELAQDEWICQNL
jgi:hypothetical protein